MNDLLAESFPLGMVLIKISMRQAIPVSAVIVLGDLVILVLSGRCTKRVHF